MESNTPASIYELVNADAGKTTVTNLAKQLNLRSNNLLAMLTEHCSVNKLPLPTLTWKEAPKAPKPAKVIERTNTKQALSLSALRLSYYGFGEVTAWETAKVTASGVFVAGDDGVNVAMAVPQGAILVYPSLPVASEAPQTAVEPLDLSMAEFVPAVVEEAPPVITEASVDVPEVEPVAESNRDVVEAGETSALPTDAPDEETAMAEPVGLTVGLTGGGEAVLSINMLTAALARAGV